MFEKIEDALKSAGLTREWDKYPTQALQMAKLYYDRESLRARNLFDTPGEPTHEFPAEPPPEALRARGLHPGRLRLGSVDLDDRHPAPALPGAGTRAVRRREPVRALEYRALS